jgi:hypothetical protein
MLKILSEKENMMTHLKILKVQRKAKRFRKRRQSK